MAHLIAMEKRIAMLQAIVEKVFDALHIGAADPGSLEGDHRVGRGSGAGRRALWQHRPS